MFLPTTIVVASIEWVNDLRVRLPSLITQTHVFIDTSLLMQELVQID